MIIETCLNCVHYQFGRKCAAFPDKIPDKIWKGEDDHIKPLPEQKNDVVFKQIEISEL